jgi:hypothetical protein
VLFDEFLCIDGILFKAFDKLSKLCVNAILFNVLSKDGVERIPHLMGDASIDHGKHCILGLLHIIEDVLRNINELQHNFLFILSDEL